MWGGVNFAMDWLGILGGGGVGGEEWVVLIPAIP